MTMSKRFEVHEAQLIKELEEVTRRDLVMLQEIDEMDKDKFKQLKELVDGGFDVDVDDVIDEIDVDDYNNEEK